MGVLTDAIREAGRQGVIPDESVSVPLSPPGALASDAGQGDGQVSEREQAVIDKYRSKFGKGSLSQSLAESFADIEIDTRRQQRAYAEQAPPEMAEPVKEMLSNLGDRQQVLSVIRQMTPEQRQEALRLAPGIAQQLGDDRGGVVGRTLGAVSRGISHGVSQPTMELVGSVTGSDWGGTPEEIEYIRQLDAAAAQEFNPARPGDPWYERGPLQAVEMAPWMATVVGGAGAGRAAAAGVAGKLGLAARGVANAGKAGELAGITAAAFPGQYAQEVDQLKELGMEDNLTMRLLAGGTAAIAGLVEGIVPNPFGAGKVPLTDGAIRAARQYLWNAAKNAPGEMTEEYLQGVTSGLGKTVAQYLDENAEEKSISDAFNTGWEQAKEAALPMAFLLGAPAIGGAGISAVRAQRMTRLQEALSKGTISRRDAKELGIEGKSQEERTANAQAELEASAAIPAEDAQVGPQTQVPSGEAEIQNPDEVANRAADLFAKLRTAQETPTEKGAPNASQVQQDEARNDAGGDVRKGSQVDSGGEVRQPGQEQEGEKSKGKKPAAPEVQVDPVTKAYMEAEAVGEFNPTKIQQTDERRAKHIGELRDIFNESVAKGQQATPFVAPGSKRQAFFEELAKEAGGTLRWTDVGNQQLTGEFVKGKEQPAETAKPPVSEPTKAEPTAAPPKPAVKTNWKLNDRVFIPEGAAGDPKAPKRLGEIISGSASSDSVTVKMDDGGQVRVKKEELQLPDAKFEAGEQVRVPWAKGADNAPATISKVLPDGKYEVTFASGRVAIQRGDQMIKLEGAKAPSATQEPLPWSGWDGSKVSKGQILKTGLFHDLSQVPEDIAEAIGEGTIEAESGFVDRNGNFITQEQGEKLAPGITGGGRTQEEGRKKKAAGLTAAFKITGVAAAKQKPESTTGLGEIGDAGAAIADNLYKGVLDSLKKTGSVPTPERKSSIGKAWDRVKGTVSPEDFVERLRKEGPDAIQAPESNVAQQPKPKSPAAITGTRDFEKQLLQSRVAYIPGIPNGRWREAVGTNVSFGNAKKRDITIAQAAEKTGVSIDELRMHQERFDDYARRGVPVPQSDVTDSSGKTTAKPEMSPTGDKTTAKPPELRDEDEVTAAVNAAFDERFGEGAKRPIKKQTLADKAKARKERTSAVKAEKLAKLKDLLKQKKITSGVDPELLTATVELTAAAIDDGVSTFAEYVTWIAENIGETATRKIAPYLEAGWRRLGTYDKFRGKIDDAGKVSDVLTKSADYGTVVSPNRVELGKHFADRFAAGASYSRITDARREAAELIGGMPKDGTSAIKDIDEAVEIGVVQTARDIAQSDLTDDEIYEQLVDLYDRQPTLGTRTSTSIAEQAYSTPAPLAFVVNRRAGVTQDDTVYDSSAGNGMLLIAGGKRYANEINPARAEALQAQGIETTSEDATSFTLGKEIDALVINPPFGQVKDSSGKPKQWVIDGVRTDKIDHAITLQSLKDIPDDGKVAIIIGAKGFEKREPKPDSQRGAAYLGDKRFYDTVYDNYNVVDHFTVHGDMYSRQGASFPVDVIVVDGRGKSQRPKPYNITGGGIPQVVRSWEELKNEKLRSVAGAGSASAERGKGTDSEQVDVRDEVPTSRDAEKPQAKPSSGRMGAEDRGEPRPERLGKPDGQPGVADAANAEGAVARGSDEAKAEPSDTGQRDVERPGRPSRRTSVKPDETAETDYQVTYPAGSKNPGVQTLIPRNHQAAASKSLDAVEEAYGDIDAFVSSELGYTQEQFKDVFSAEQVDALALAIARHKDGGAFIIGDQTGVGKGRAAAAMMIYAKRQGMVPVFITEKPTLYADMMRDLIDIGQSTDDSPFNPLVTNALSGDDVIPLPDGRELKQSVAAAKNNVESATESVARGEGLVAKKKGRGKQKPTSVEYDAIFTTYAQVRPREGMAPARANWLKRIAPKSFFILDESHNAGGSGDSDPNANQDRRSDGKEVKITSAEIVRDIISDAGGVYFSSATYAKRPQTMGLYSRTGMTAATNNDPARLSEAIAEGGVPLQQAVSEQLVESGMYLRRERSFDGVEFSPKTVGVDLSNLDDISAIFNAINTLDGYAQEAIAAAADEITSQGGAIRDTEATGQAGVESTAFSSILHNLVDQMLLAVKADAVADETIASIKAGEAPVIYVDSTLEAALRRQVESLDADIGDVLDFSYRDLVRRYLERSREYTVRRNIDDAESVERVRLTDAELGPEGVAAYERALEMIDSFDGDMPASPIDWIRKRVSDAGYSIGEITGRQVVLDYGDDGLVRLGRRLSEEAGAGGRTETVAKFNDGALDAVLINQSGSTGISMHASEKFQNQKPRHMIIGQPARNIDTFMQALGRVHRTGQVVLPRFTLMMTNAPAEIRPASVLVKKLASLNANVTASDKGAVSFDVPDVINIVGDQIVAEYLADHLELDRAIGELVQLRSDGSPRRNYGIAKKASGRMALRPVAEQQQFWDSVVDAYAELIDELNRIGKNPLAAATLDLEAKTLESTTIFEGDESSDNAFSQPASIELVRAKKPGAPMTPDEITEAVSAFYGKPVSDAVVDEWMRTTREELQRAYDEYVSEQTKNLTGDLLESRLRTAQTLGERQLSSLTDKLESFAPGMSVSVYDRNGDGSIQDVVPGFVTSIKRSKGGNPLAASKWSIQVAIASPDRIAKTPLSRVGEQSAEGSDYREFLANNELIDEPQLKQFADTDLSPTENRYIGVGNILAAYSQLGKSGGQIVFFTDSAGEVRRGVLMPRSFNIDRWTEARPVVLDEVSQIREFLNSGGLLVTPDRAMNVMMVRGDMVLRAPKAKSKGGKYTLNSEILSAASPLEFVSIGSRMEMVVSDQQQQDAVLAAVMSIGPLQSAEGDKQLARQIKERGLSDTLDDLPDSLAQTESDDINEDMLQESVNIAFSAWKAGIKTYDELVAFSVKKLGEERTRVIGAYLYQAGKTAEMQGLRPTRDVLGTPVTREQVVTFAKASFPMLTDEQVETGIGLLERLGISLDKIGYAPFGTPVPGSLVGRADILNQESSSRVSPGLAKKLDAGEKVTLYRAMSLIDGKLYPPMSAKIQSAEGKLSLRNPEPVGQWMRSEERKDLVPKEGAKAGKFPLKKPGGGTTWALYAPYFHASPIPLNDQFTSAWKNDGVDRPQLVTVEIEVPASELTSSYQAEGSKKKTGSNKWNSGVVASKVPGGREVVLSRYARIKRVVPDSEVAEKIAAIVNPQRIAIPENTVTPQLRAELEKQGVRIVPKGTSGQDVLYQEQRDASDTIKGWTQFISATRAIIGATDKADFSTFIHEIFHPMRRFLLDRNIPQEQRYGITDEDIKALEDYVGVENGDWKFTKLKGDEQARVRAVIQAEEKAVRAWEQYWFEGQVPKNSGLESLFEKISRWMRDVYNGIQEITGGRPLPDDVRKLFNKLVQRGMPADTAKVDEGAPPPVKGSLDKPSDEEATSIKNEVANELRARRGVPELADVATETQEEWLEAAEAKLQQDPYLGDRLVKEIHNKARNLSNIEVAVMQIYYRQVNNQLEKASNRLFDAHDRGDTLEKARAQIETDLILATLDEIEEATKKAGREWGRAGVARQIVLAKDFSLAGMMRKARIANAGNPLNEKQQEEIAELARQVAELEGQLAKAEQEKIDRERQRAVSKGIEDDKKQVKKPARKSVARQKAVDAVSAFKKKFSTFFSGPDTLAQTEEERMAEEAEQVVQAYVESGVSSFGEFMANVKRDLGDDMPIEARVAFATAWESLKSIGEIPVPELDRTNLSGMTRFARRIQRALVEAGITERDEVVTAVHESLLEIVPDITRRETMDALSGYGQYTPLSDNEIDKVIRDINGQLQQLAKIEDLRANIPPKKTGGERRTPSTEERELIREVNELKRNSEYYVTDPATQLKTSIGAAKTAAFNRITDIKKALKTGKRIVQSQGADLTGKDPELDDLRKQLAEWTKLYKAQFPKPGMTDAQRIAAASRALDKAIADLEEQLRTGDVAPKGRKEPISTPELETQRLRLEELRAQREAIRAQQNPKMTPEERAEKVYKANLMKRIADYQERMVKNDFDPRPRKEPRKLSQAELDTKRKLADVKDEFFRKARDYRLAHMSPVERLVDIAKETAHFSRAAMTSIDLSAVFRQGGVAAFSHPKLAQEASKEMLAALISKDSEFDIAETIRNDDMYQFAMTAGLSITEEEGKITRQEEAYMGRWASKFPGIAASARAYTTFLNGMRFRLFKYMVNSLGEGGQVTTDEAKVIADYVNAATGRSNLGKFNQATANASVLFFAPRYVLSRLQYMAMPFYILPSSKVSGRVKKAIAMEYARYLRGITGFLGLTVALGSLLTDDDDEKPTVEIDPRSSDFMKLRFGDTRIDPMSGFSQVIVFGTKVLKGQEKTFRGDIRDLRGPNVEYGGRDTAEVIWRFLRSKFAPIPAAGVTATTVDWSTGIGEDFIGNEIPFITANPLKPSIARDLFVPLSLREVADAMKAQGVPAGAAIATLALLGMGGGTYGDRTKYLVGSEEEREEQLAKDLKSMQWDSPDPPYSEFLTIDQMEQVQNRREERKQSLVYAATASPVRKDYRSDETFEKSVAERDAALEVLKQSGITSSEARQMLLDYWKRTYGSPREIKGRYPVLKDSVLDRIRQINRVFRDN